jgi:hypothetical protein
MGSFSFVNERHIIVGAISNIISEGENSRPVLLVYDFDNAHGATFRLEDNEHLCAFLFPDISRWTIPLTISIRSEPSPAWAPHPDMQVPFHIAPDQRLFVITFWASLRGHLHSFVLFVPLSTFLSFVDQLEHGGYQVDWDHWGPRGTRMIPGIGQSDVWVCYVFGMKFTVTGASADEMVAAVYKVYDFNQLAIRRVQTRAQLPVDGTTVVTQCTVLSPGVFAEPVTTHLPYRSRTMVVAPKGRQPTGFTAVMCSEDNIVAVVAVSGISVVLMFANIRHYMHC